MRHALITLSTVALLGTPLVLAGCNSELDGKTAAVVETPQPADETPEATRAVAKTLVLDAQTSSVEFVGAKVTADHRGRFDKSEGEVELDPDGNIVGMQVTIDTQSVNIEPAQLQAHLRSPDFFDVAKYPKASFRLHSVRESGGEGSYQVKGDLELRGVTKRISFPAKAKIADERVTADASFTIDRKDFGIVYAGMADDLIKDEVLLDLKLEFRTARGDRS